MSKVIKLFYFPVRARAEPIRMMLTHGNIPYVDEIVELKNWAALKAAKDICPFGQLPSISLPNGKIIAQTNAISLFIAKQANMYPSDLYAAARVDAIFGLAEDMAVANPLLNMFDTENEKFSEKYSLYFRGFDSRMESAEKMLGQSKYFGGNFPSYADFALLHAIDVSLSLNPGCLAKRLRLQEWMEAMKELPSLREYMINRPQPPDVGVSGSFIQTKLEWNMF